MLTARVATLEQERRDGAWLSDPLPTDRRSLWHLVACYSQRVSEAREALNRIVLSR